MTIRLTEIASVHRFCPSWWALGELPFSEQRGSVSEHAPRHAQALFEQLAAIDKHLPAGVTLDHLFDDIDVQQAALPDPEIARAYGWIEGFADAEDVTIWELLDAGEIDLASLPAR